MSVKFEKNPLNKDLYKIEGSKCIMLAIGEKKEYTVKFYAYNEGSVKFYVSNF